MEEKRNYCISTYNERTYNYYHSKLKSRDAFENIINIGNENEIEQKTSTLTQEFSNVFRKIAEPVKNLFLILRNNYEYILKLISIIESNEELLQKSDTLVELFCHQFYDNILIPNSDQEELLTLIYLLLEKEVAEMDSASLSSFIDENISFAGKFLKSFAKSQELKSYLSMNLSSLILEIEGSNKKYDLSPSRINDRYQQEKMNIYAPSTNNEVCFEFNMLTTDIPKTSIPIDTELILEEDDDVDDDMNSDYNYKRSDSNTSDIECKKELTKKASGELEFDIEDENEGKNKNNNNNDNNQNIVE